MACANEQLSSLLSDYFSGHLPPADLAQVEAHLKSCPECRESVRMMTLMSPAIDHGQQSHPAKSLLMQYYRNPDTLQDDLGILIRDHLATCRDCSAELEWLNQTETELVESLKTGQDGRDRIVPLVARYGRYVAYAAAACLLVMVGSRVMQDDQIQPTPQVIYRLHEAVRGTGDATEVRRTDGAKTLRFELPYYHNSDEYGYSVYILDSTTRSRRASASRIQFPQGGRLYAECRSAELPDGDYQVVVEEIARIAARDTTVTFFPFRLITSR